MSLDQEGRRAAESLREQVEHDLDTSRMLASVRRTRARRRVAAIVPAALAVAIAFAAVHGTPSAGGSTPVAPISPSQTALPTPATPRANGVLFGMGPARMRAPGGLHVPPLGFGSSPTWSPDGNRVAVLAGGILVIDVRTGAQTTLPCSSCTDIAWSLDGRSIAAAGIGGAPLGLVDAVTGAVTPVPLRGVTSVSSVSWSAASDRLGFLATAPVGRQGAYVVGADGQDQREIVSLPTTFTDTSDRAKLLAMRWSPKWDELALLSASPLDTRVSSGDLALFVQTYHPDGSVPNLLVDDGTCACVGFEPDLTWSPDGTTLAVMAQQPRRSETRLDGDGHPITVRFIRGSGQLSWQPR